MQHREGASKAQLPRHHPDLLTWAEPRHLHVNNMLLGESGTHKLSELCGDRESMPGQLAEQGVPC